MRLRPRRPEDPDINLTSLIDVVLLLLVFFMLSSTFIQEGRLRIRLPETADAPLQAQRLEAITVTVTASGSFRVNDLELINASAETLRLALARTAGDDRERPIVLRADARSTHQSVVTAMDVIGKLGFSEVSIATVNEEGGAAQP